MAFNYTLSAILRGYWLIDKQWADAQLPMVMSFIRGENVNFGFAESTPEDTNPTLFLKNAALNVNVYSVRPNTNVKELPGGSIAMVDISGPMMKRGGLCSYGMVDQAQLITNLGNASNVDGIILNIDSPGGQADGTQLLSDAINNVKAKKPVIAVIDDGMAASAAMWIASSAQEIYVTQSTDQVCSIGVYTSIADWNSYYKDALKLNVQDIYAPQSTDKNKDYRDAINGDTSAIEQGLSVLADQFINTVAANRAGKIKGDSWKTGKMFYAKDAMKIGLIDGIKSFDQVVNRMTKLTNYPTYSQHKNSNNMAFTKTRAAAKAESFAVVEGGFLLEENQLNNIEASLEAAENTNASLETANASIVTLTEELSAEKVNLSTAQSTISTQAARITALEAEVVALGQKPSGKGTALPKEKDDSAEEAEKPSYASDSNPANEWLDKQMSLRQKGKL